MIQFWHLDVKWVFVALPFGCLVTLLFYFDVGPFCSLVKHQDTDLSTGHHTEQCLFLNGSIKRFPSKATCWIPLGTPPSSLPPPSTTKRLTDPTIAGLLPTRLHHPHLRYPRTPSTKRSCTSSSCSYGSSVGTRDGRGSGRGSGSETY